MAASAANGVRALLLAAGRGSRLRPLTDEWPKSLMPIGGRPLLEYWLGSLRSIGVRDVLVNVHHHAEQMARFLDRPCYRGWVRTVHETRPLGTAGTLSANREFFEGRTTLLVHADNWCQCDLGAFMAFHRHRRPVGCPVTMMTFDTPTPETCGIVETDATGVVIGFHEKVADPPGNHANGAVYLLEPEMLDWLARRPDVRDFSTEVLPNFVGRIATWHNSGIHRDIGTPEMLALAQQDLAPDPPRGEIDDWSDWFRDHPVHRQVTDLAAACEPTL